MGFYTLNVLRIGNLIVLVANMAAFWALIVAMAMANLVDRFYFFDGSLHFWFFVVNVFLALSEIQFGRVKIYFAKSWPIFGPAHNFGCLGLGLLITGCDLLGNLSKPQFNQASLRMPIWNLVLSAGISSLVFASLNIVTAFIFRDPENGVTSYMIRASASATSAPPSLSIAADGVSSQGESEQRTKNAFWSVFWRRNASRGKSPSTPSAPLKRDLQRNIDIEAARHSHVIDPESHRGSVLQDMQHPASVHSTYASDNRSIQSDTRLD